MNGILSRFAAAIEEVKADYAQSYRHQAEISSGIARIAEARRIRAYLMAHGIDPETFVRGRGNRKQRRRAAKR